VQSPSGEANRSSAGQEISHILWNQAQVSLLMERTWAVDSGLKRKGAGDSTF